MKPKSLALVVACACALGTLGCEREARRFQEPAAMAAAPKAPPGAGLQAGGEGHVQPVSNPAEQNAHAVAQGKRLFGWYNCTGCHGHGGGGMGPALMDDKWIYGAEPANVFESIVKGRPNGMPSYGGKLPESQVWQIVAYVRSMSGLLKSDVAPGRNDDMQTGPPESRRDKSQPTTTGRPGE